MPIITDRGRNLAKDLARYCDLRSVHVATLSTIARHAATHLRYAVAECNRELTPAEVRKVERIEARIRQLVATLPETPKGPLTVKFGGDPRGYTVKIVVPGEPHAGNTWGRDGEFGV